MPSDLTDITNRLRQDMEAQHAAREIGLAGGRRIIQLSSRAIKHIHRRQSDETEKLLVELRQLVKSVIESVRQFPAIQYSAALQDAIKEYVEAETLCAIVEGVALPEPSELGVTAQAYVNGLCEAASECRRYALDTLRAGDFQRARALADVMEDIYDELITFDFPDALTSNLRRNVDALRAVLERTQSDLAVTATQLELIAELQKVKR